MKEDHTRRPGSGARAFLLLLLLVFAGGNLWAAWKRTLIPIALEAVVVDTTLLHEKHPGRDDVHILALRPASGGPERRLRVEAPIYREVSRGDRLEKRAWETRLEAGGRTLWLEPGPVAGGMFAAMLCAVAPAITLLLWGRFVSRRGREESGGAS